jgi:hypothetical protein
MVRASAKPDVRTVYAVLVATYSAPHNIGVLRAIRAMDARGANDFLIVPVDVAGLRGMPSADPALVSR